VIEGTTSTGDLVVVAVPFQRTVVRHSPQFSQRAAILNVKHEFISSVQGIGLKQTALENDAIFGICFIDILNKNTRIRPAIWRGATAKVFKITFDC